MHSITHHSKEFQLYYRRPSNELISFLQLVQTDAHVKQRGKVRFPVLMEQAKQITDEVARWIHENIAAGKPVHTRHAIHTSLMFVLELHKLASAPAGSDYPACPHCGESLEYHWFEAQLGECSCTPDSPRACGYCTAMIHIKAINRDRSMEVIS